MVARTGRTSSSPNGVRAARSRIGNGRAETRATLQELRERAGKTQHDVALSSGVSQIEVSRAERRTDHKVSTLRRYVKALGGELLVYARFGGRLVRLRDV